MASRPVVMIALGIVYRSDECRVMPLSAVTRLDADKRQVRPRTCRRLHYKILNMAGLSLS